MAEKPFAETDYRRLGKMIKGLVESETINHHAIYAMNFFRGIFFGLGVALGGTFVLACVVWILSLFTELPWIGDFADTIKKSIDGNQ